MHTIDLLEEATALAASVGWTIRHESLKGLPGGACRLGQQYLLFMDRSLTAGEQLEQVLHALRSEQGPEIDDNETTRNAIASISPALRKCLTATRTS